MKSITERDLLHELFPDTARELFGEGSATRSTLGLYPIADGRLALVRRERLVELEPIEIATKKNAFLCDLCHVTRSRSEIALYRAHVAPRTSRYVTLCVSGQPCLGRAGPAGLAAFADRLLD